MGLKTQAIKEALEFLVTAGLIKTQSSHNSDIGALRTTTKGEAALTQYYQLVTQYFANSPQL